MLHPCQTQKACAGCNPLEGPCHTSLLSGRLGAASWAAAPGAPDIAAGPAEVGILPALITFLCKLSIGLHAAQFASRTTTRETCSHEHSYAAGTHGDRCFSRSDGGLCHAGASVNGCDCRRRRLPPLPSAQERPCTSTAAVCH